MLRIGIDGGGTTTRAIIINDNLQILGRGEAGSSNHYSVGVERLTQHVEEAVGIALKSAGASSDEVASWGLGLAGACTPTEQTMLYASLAPLAQGKTLVVDEDAAAAQAGAFVGGSGAVSIAGTGANCFGVNEQGARARADGLGPLLGDRGSGYWIGEYTLRAVCRANDGSGPPTALLDAVLQQLEIASVDALVQLVYQPDFERDRIAALFPVVVRCAAERDDVAQQVLQAAGRELATTAHTVLQKLEIARVAVSGGVLQRDTPVRASFEAALRAAMPNVQVQEPQYDAAVGAALLARPASGAGAAQV
ncbi:MAG TPA: BadF/BadG/BcrA/BcrD ATPase family protein [Abditibacteriaceae bacterium]|nr:BadF/BadG/BcrA/BcrD ATPase family protein [Abditibacteriaceae bacterium]